MAPARGRSPRRGSTRGRSQSPAQPGESLLKRGASKSPHPKRVSFAPNVSKGDTSPEQHFEFGGPLGATAVTFGLPLVIYLLYFLSTKKDYVLLTYANLQDFKLLALLDKLPKQLWATDDAAGWLTVTAAQIFMGWMALCVVLERLLPGERVTGVAPHSLSYWLSGHLQFWVTLFLLFFGNVTLEWSEHNHVHFASAFSAFPLEVLYDEYLGLITISCLFSFALSLYLYASSFVGDKVLAEHGNTGFSLYDFFIGRELNPRLFNNTFDLKEFCELRPGLIGWAVLNIGMAFKQHQNLGYVSFSMVLVVLYQGLYVWDALFNERAILTTMDITTDGFGYMLAFGDLAWVPFIYSLQARFLVEDDPKLSSTALVFISLVHFFGLFVFRSSNSEKDRFRRNPDAPECSHLSFLQTQRGTKLLVSGWWGMARKINYTGDWLITFAWCLLCGCTSPVPYFQAIYFAVLLVHRADRDDKMCHDKYGDDWLEYKKRVPYLFIPYVY